MAAPDLSHVTAGLSRARGAVEAAKSKVTDPEAVSALDNVDVQLQEAQARVEEALAKASEYSGGQV